MFEQLFDGFRKASESSMFAQQEMLKQWIQQWPSASLSTVQATIERNSAFQKRWLESATEALTKQRDLLDSACKAGIQIMEQASRLSEAKSPDEYRRLIEEMWRKLFEVMKTQSEAQFNELVKASQTLVETAQVR